LCGGASGPEGRTRLGGAPRTGYLSTSTAMSLAVLARM